VFRIGFTNDPIEFPYDDESVPAAVGELILEESREVFVANVSLWTKLDYQRHWTQALTALLKGSPKVSLVVCYSDPRFSSNQELWNLHRDGEWVHFQNKLMWNDNLPADFDPLEMNAYINDRISVDEDGNKISEWHVPIREIENFLKTS
jgi:hypothetical protein